MFMSSLSDYLTKVILSTYTLAYRFSIGHEYWHTNVMLVPKLQLDSKKLLQAVTVTKTGHICCMVKM